MCAISKLEFSEKEIPELEIYKTGNFYTVGAQTVFNEWGVNESELVKKDEYYLNGKRFILIEDYCKTDYKYRDDFRFIFHPYMKQLLDELKNPPENILFQEVLRILKLNIMLMKLVQYIGLLI